MLRGHAVYLHEYVRILEVPNQLLEAVLTSWITVSLNISAYVYFGFGVFQANVSTMLICDKRERL